MSFTKYFAVFFGKRQICRLEHPNEQNVGWAKFLILILLSALHHLKRIYEFQSKLKKRIWVTFVNEVEPGGHLLLTSSTVDQTPRLPPQRCWTTIKMVVIIQLYKWWWSTWWRWWWRWLAGIFPPWQNPTMVGMCQCQNPTVQDKV